MNAAALCVVVLALGQDPGTGAAAELARHQGAWIPVRFEREGTVTPEEILASIRRTVDGDHVTWSRDGKPFAGTRFEVDATANPATIDLIADGGPAAREAGAGHLPRSRKTT